MKKRLLSFVLTFCMMLTLLPTAAFAETTTDYGIWVGTTKVTSDNANGVTGDGITGTVTYDASSNTLTLNNASITSLCLPSQNGNSFGENGASGGIFRNSGNLNIVLIGENKVDISGVTGQTQSFGINSMGMLQISGTETSSLTVTSASNTTYSFGINGSLGVAISGCTVTAIAGSSGVKQSPHSAGISTGSGTLSITDAHVTATGGNTSGSKVSYGICAIGNVVITQSTVNATGGGVVSGESCGMYVYNTYTDVYYKNAFSDSNITAAGDTRALNITGSSTVTGLAATAGADKTGTGAAAVTLDSGVYGSSNFYKYVKISPAPPAQAQWGVAGSDGSAPASWVNSGTLADAMTYANSNTGTYIQLLADIALSSALTINGTTSIAIDLNGNILSGENADKVISHLGTGTLTITDNSTSGGGKVETSAKDASAIYSLGNGKLIISGKAAISSASETISISNAGTLAPVVLEIAGGTVTAPNSGQAIGSSSAGEIIVTDGTITGGNGIASYRGKVTVSGGTVTSYLESAIYALNAIVTLKGGTFENIGTSSYTKEAIQCAQLFIPSGSVIIKGSKGAMNVEQPYLTGYTSYQWRTSSSSGFTLSTTQPYIHSPSDTYVEFQPYSPPVIGTLSIPDSFTAGRNYTLNDLNA